MFGITQKHINVLKVLDERETIVATWSHAELNALESFKFARSGSAYQASGKLSSNKLWAITDAGRDFLRIDRAGQ